MQSKLDPIAPIDSMVRRAKPDDLPVIARMLVRAYMDDPITMWICRSESLRARTLHGLYSARLSQMLTCGEIWISPDRASAAVWLSPGRAKPGIRPTAPLLRCVLDPRLTVRLPLLAYGLHHMDRSHPHDPPHWYLSLLGTDPACQGQGLASAVLRPVLRRCDIDGVGAYLESSKQSNLSFYARHSFEVKGALTLPAGPKMWPMWRKPPGGRSAT